MGRRGVLLTAVAALVIYIVWGLLAFPCVLHAVGVVAALGRRA